jgi:Type IV pilin-like G and H, putative
MINSNARWFAAKSGLALGILGVLALIGCANAGSIDTASASSPASSDSNPGSSPGSSPDNPAVAVPPEGGAVDPNAPYVGTWAGKQIGTAEDTQAILTFKPEGITYTLLKRGVDYTALATPWQYEVSANRFLFNIDLRNPQTSAADDRWGIMSMSNNEQLLLTIAQTSVPRPDTFEPNFTLDLTRRPDTPWSISPSLARIGQFYLEHLVEQQLASYIEKGQFSALDLSLVTAMPSSYYRYEIASQSEDLIKIDAIPNQDGLPSYTAVIAIDTATQLTPAQLTATLCRSNAQSFTPPSMPTLSQSQWQCAAGSTKPDLPAL